MLAVPVAVGVKLTLQDAALALTLVKVQLFWSKFPASPVALKLTEPPGVRGVPPLEVSLTVAVQDEDWLRKIGLTQLIVVALVRRLTVIIAGKLLELAE